MRCGGKGEGLGLLRMSKPNDVMSRTADGEYRFIEKVVWIECFHFFFFT